MNRIVQILIGNHVFFLFIILSLISLQILTKHNFLIESRLDKCLNEWSSFIFLKEQELKDYFYLKKENENLLKNNQILLQQNIVLEKKLQLIQYNTLLIDTILSNVICQGKIVKKTWNKQHNFIVVNRGRQDSIKSNMVVVHNNCLVGITNTVSDNFSKIISIINTNLMISAKLKNSGHYGTLSWDGKNPHIIQLNDIPKHAVLNIGDTIVTSGYSNIFPENIKIGTILNYHSEENTNFLHISIKLFVDFTNIEFVYIIKNHLQSERILIEEK